MKKSTLIAMIFMALTVSRVSMAQEQTPPQIKSKITQRQINQQKKIKQGVKSGQLTRGETRRLERQQARIQMTKQTDKAENGDKLTPKEKAHINRMQNHASRHIYRAKHNANVQK